MTTISGNNYSYTGNDIVNSTGLLIVRIITANSNDTLPTAIDLINTFAGSVGQTITSTIYNNSSFKITLSGNTGLTFISLVTDEILPQAVKTYTFVQDSASTIVVYTTSNSSAQPTVDTNIQLANGNILVGNSNGIASGVTPSGGVSVSNAGVFAVVTNANLTGPITSVGNATSIASQTGTGSTFVMNTSPTLVSPNIGAATGTSLTTSGSLRSATSIIIEDPGAGTNTISIQAPTLASGYVLTLPVDDGLSGQVLSTDGAGVLSWTTAGSGSVTSVSGTTNRITSSGGINPVIDISAAYVGQNSITTLGTIGTGVWNGSVIPGQYGGTGVANTGRTITLGGNLTTSGAFASTFTVTGTTAVTFPVSGTLATTSQLPTPAALTKVDDTNITLTLGGTPSTALLQATSITAGWTGQLGLTRGGTNASLVASNGGIFYSTATAGAILSGTATARQMLQSGASTTPSWSTTTWPASSTANQILYSSATNIIGEITTGNNGVLITSAGGVPSISSTLPSAVQGNITSTGTLTSVVNTTNTTAATSVLTGSIITSGGIGIAKNMWIGSAFTGANAGVDGSLINIPSFTYTSSTASPGNVNIDAIGQITLNGTGTATNATSLYIAGPPLAGTLAITNPYSLQVASGNSNFNGNVNISNTLTTDNISKIGTTQTLWSDSVSANIGCSTSTGTTNIDVGMSDNSNIQSSVMSTWTAAAPDATKSWTSVCYGSGLFVSVSNSAGAAAGLVRTSTDGITWTSRTASSVNTWSAVCFAPDINRFCAVSSNGAANTSAMFSNDGITWIQTTTLAAGTYSSVCRSTNLSGSLGNIFVTTNSSGVTTTTQIYTSPDGVTWTARNVGSAANYNFSSCCWSDSLKLFVAVGTLAAAGAQIVTSSNGITWTNRSSPSTQQWRSVCWSSELGLFVAVASNGTTTTQIMTSTTGTTWTNATRPSAQAWQSVCWSSKYKMFVAVANNGTAAQQIMYSSTGTGTWTAATSTSAIAWNCITFSENLNRFVAVAASAVAGNGMYTTIPTGYNTNLSLGTTGSSNISFNASNLVVYPIPYYYGENTITRGVTAGVPLTDITIYDVPNGRYLVQIWMLSLLKTGVATTDFIIMTGSVQGTIFSFTATPGVSLVGSASASGASTGPKFFQFAINSYSTSGIQNVSYQYQSSGTNTIFTTGTLRTMVLQRIG